MILDCFTTEMNKTFEILRGTVTRNAYYEPVQSYTSDGVSHPACLYSKSLAEKYFGDDMWGSSVSYVLVSYPVDIDSKCKVTVDSKTYAVDSVDDVAGMNEVMLIGLKRSE